MSTHRLTYKERAATTTNGFAKQLFSLLETKKTNLALSADVTTANELLTLADTLGPEICILKTHIDIITDFEPALITQLQALAKKHQFMLFEDRKFADIGNTVSHQYQNGLYRIADWANIINAHGLPGPGIVQGLMKVGLAKERGLLLIAEMSSGDNLFSKTYTQQILTMAEQFPEFVFGFISQHRLSQDPRWVYMTPGIQFAVKGDTLGQQYVTPEQAIQENGSDIIIVGRGIIAADNPVVAAQHYREAGWNAYLSPLS